MIIRQLSLIEVEYAAFRLARELMTWDEPIPEFGLRFPNILESCLNAPFQTFGKKQLYPGLVHKASILFYLMIKNHPFKNGNKRIAIMTLLYFLYENKKWLHARNREMYEFAKWVAESDPRRKDGILAAVRGFLEEHMIELDEAMRAKRG